jgi:hypothetical protein
MSSRQKLKTYVPVIEPDSLTTENTTTSISWKWILLYFLIGFVVLVIVLILFLRYLMWKSKPTFTVEELEHIVHKAVRDFDELHQNYAPDDVVAQAKHYYEPEITNGKNGSITDETLIECYLLEMKLKFIHDRFIAAFPGKILTDFSRWGYQNIQGVSARQLVLLCTPVEYLCIWVISLESNGFSGAFPKLNEGDVMISGQVDSSDPETRLSAARSYTFGQTSRLEPGRRRTQHIKKNTAMLSFGLHDSTMIGSTFWNGVIGPFLFENNDSKSFWIEIEDSAKSTWSWIVQTLNEN